MSHSDVAIRLAKLMNSNRNRAKNRSTFTDANGDSFEGSLTESDSSQPELLNAREKSNVKVGGGAVKGAIAGAPGGVPGAAVGAAAGLASDLMKQKADRERLKIQNEISRRKNLQSTISAGTSNISRAQEAKLNNLARALL